jgi:hypothetical protein
MAFKGKNAAKAARVNNKAAQAAKSVNKNETGLQFMWTVGHGFNSDKHKLSRCIARFFGYMLTSLWADRKSLKEILKEVKFHLGVTFSGGFKIEFGIYFPKTV